MTGALTDALERADVTLEDGVAGQIGPTLTVAENIEGDLLEVIGQAHARVAGQAPAGEGGAGAAGGRARGERDGSNASGEGNAGAGDLQQGDVVLVVVSIVRGVVDDALDAVRLAAGVQAVRSDDDGDSGGRLSGGRKKKRFGIRFGSFDLGASMFFFGVFAFSSARGFYFYFHPPLTRRCSGRR